MYHRGRKKMRLIIITAVLLLSYPTYTLHKTIATHEPHASQLSDDHLDNTIIDFEEDYSTKFNKKHGIPWNSDNYFNKESHRYTLIKDYDKNVHLKGKNKTQIADEETTTVDYSVIPLELISTTESEFSVVDSTVENDLTVIPLATTEKSRKIEIKQTVILPTSTEGEESTTEIVTEKIETTTPDTENITQSETTVKIFVTESIVNKDKLKENVTLFSFTDKYIPTTEQELTTDESTTDSITEEGPTTFKPLINSTNSDKLNETIEAFNSKYKVTNKTRISNPNEVTTSKNTSNVISRDRNINRTIPSHNSEDDVNSTTFIPEDIDTTITPPHNTSRENDRSDNSSTEESEVPIFTELDTEDQVDVPEDYYDTKDVVPTTAPKTDALSVIFGLAGSVVESVAERVVPKSIFDLFKRMQRQNEALEAERLRSREENGGLGQFGRGILKSISTGIGKPLSQLMAGVRDIGSLDSDRGFVTSLASGVTSVANVANSVVDAFKDRVQAIYPGTVWCGDGRSATARSSDLGLFFFTDTCCRQHDACKLYIRAGETKYGLTNTGLFTRSHCSCDAKFRECLGRTNSLVSAQIGLTYFNVLGPQCFRRAHPIVRCVRRTRITGQKCEEYELDNTKPRMWQWFDNETF